MKSQIFLNSFYLSIEEAKKGIALVYAVTDGLISDMEEHFEGRACLFLGEDLPHFITYLENEIVENTREDYISECFITLESEKNKTRNVRAEKLKIFLKIYLILSRI